MTEQLPGLKGVSFGQEPNANIVDAYKARNKDRRSFGVMRCGALVDTLKSMLKETGMIAQLKYEDFRERSDAI